MRQALESWLSQFPSSGHPLDEQRFYTFVQASHKEGNLLDEEEFTQLVADTYEKIKSQRQDQPTDQLSTESVRRFYQEYKIVYAYLSALKVHPELATNLRNYIG